MMQKIQLIRLHDGRAFELESISTVGRRDDCSIVLEESGVSRLHAEFTFLDGQLSIEDFSRNGTKVNGTVMSAPTLLQNDDIIQFYQHKYKLSVPISTTTDAANNETVVASTDETAYVSDRVFLDSSENSVYQEEDFKRKPLPERPPQEGTKLVMPKGPGKYTPLNLKNYPEPALVVRNGQSEGLAFDLNDSRDKWSIGSGSYDAGIDIEIHDEGVSSQHAVLRRTGNTWEIMDQMATNVLRVNNTTTNRCYLSTGDLISLGPIDCEFVLPVGYRPRKRKSESAKQNTKRWTVTIIILVALVLIAGTLFHLHEEGYLNDLFNQIRE